MAKEKIRHRYKRVFNFEEMWLIVPLVVILLLWNTPVIYVFKLFVVLIHEYSHGLATIATGGQINEISISLNEGGYALTSGGNEIVVISAGYLGSLLFGILLLGIAKIRKLNKWITILLAIVIFGMTMLYIKSIFAIIYSLIFGVVLFFIAVFGGKTMNYYFLRLLGLLTILYAVLDIKSDLFFNKGVNDAVLLANSTGVPAIVWSLIWGIISLLSIYYLLLTKIKKEPVFE
mgnify:FL=1